MPGDSGLERALEAGRGKKLGLQDRDGGGHPGGGAGGGAGTGRGHQSPAIEGPSRPQEVQLFFYHADHLGSSTVITDAYAEVYEHVEYFPFGEPWVDQGGTATLTPYRFTSKALDPETGLYYFGARYYEPRLQRWVSADPILDRYVPAHDQTGDDDLPGDGGVFNPRNLALFSFAALNPVGYVDPDGRQFIALELSKRRPDPEKIARYQFYEMAVAGALAGQAALPVVAGAAVAAPEVALGVPARYPAATSAAVAVSAAVSGTSARGAASAAGASTTSGLRLVVGGGRAANFPALQAGDVSLNVAMRATPHILGDIANAPFKSGAFREVFFERVPFNAFSGANIGAIGEVARILAPKGRFIIETGKGVDLAEVTAALQRAGFTNIQAQVTNFVRIIATKGE